SSAARLKYLSASEMLPRWSRSWAIVATAMSHSGSADFPRLAQWFQDSRGAYKRGVKPTLQCPLAHPLSLRTVLLHLVYSQRLVHKRQHIHRTRRILALELDRRLELLNRLVHLAHV